MTAVQLIAKQVAAAGFTPFDITELGHNVDGGFSVTDRVSVQVGCDYVGVTCVYGDGADVEFESGDFYDLAETDALISDLQNAVAKMKST